MTPVIGVLFDGLAHGSLLFLVSVGLSVTMGLMNFVNLAHGAFAMAGGYLATYAMNSLGWPFLLSLPLAFVGVGLLGWVLERGLYRHLYGAGPLPQVLFSIGLCFIAMGAVTWLFGPVQQPVVLPESLRGQFEWGGFTPGRYRLFLLGLVACLSLLLWALFEHSRFGSHIRAAVDDQVLARAMGIPVDRVFGWTFALGSALAGLGGALGVDLLGLDPSFPIRYLVYFLLVVVVGGAGSVRGSLLAALVLGVADVAGKYYLPDLGAFIIYALMIALLLIFPAGLGRRRPG